MTSGYPWQPQGGGTQLLSRHTGVIVGSPTGYLGDQVEPAGVFCFGQTVFIITLNLNTLERLV